MYKFIYNYSLELIPIDVDFKYLSIKAMDYYSRMPKIQHAMYGNKWLRMNCDEDQIGMPAIASPQHPIGRDINHITLYFRNKEEAAYFKLKHTGIT